MSDKKTRILAGETVRAVGLGGMPLSIEGRPDERTALAVIHAALDAGTNFIDTADVYCLDDQDIGHNERLIAKALRSWSGKNKVIVATKGGLIRPKGAWTTHATPQHLRKACELSLKNLGVETIFLYQLHAPDDKVPFEDSIGELKRLQEEGKIRHIGLSNVSLEELNRAKKVAQVVSVQNRCNPFYKKDFVNGFIDECAKQGVVYITHSPVGGWRSHADLAKRELFIQIGTKHSASPYAVILSWLLQKGEHILPIPGASKATSAQDSATAVNIVLSPEEIDRIDHVGAKF